MKHFFTLFLTACYSLTVCAQDKPNILWLWTEDMSYYNLAVTGNTLVRTPKLDSLARNGVLFTRAYSNGPQCSPARSTLITGMYSFCAATDWHRENRAVPSSFYFPQYLRQAGYYCTNNSKTDYNSTVANSVIWNVNGGSAHYRNRPTAATPFFAVFNHEGTHMSSITDVPISQRTNRKVQPSQTPLPGYLPNGDSLRDDRAWHLDQVMKMDEWVGKKLAELKSLGVDNNTIIFFSSDHGGCTPGSKGFVREDGVRVPLIIYFPPKWAHLKPAVTEGFKSNRMVGFVDLGPTLLSIAGIQKKSHMQGKPFLGQFAEPAREDIVCFKTNQGESFIPSRSITEKKFKLIWNYNTLWRNGMRNGFQWGMEGFREWERMYFDNQLSGVPKTFWEQQIPFELYDLESDPNELVNLANKPEHQATLNRLKAKLSQQLRDVKDLGLYPQSLRRVSDAEPFYTYVRRTNQNVNRVIETAELASTATAANITTLNDRLLDPDAAVRYWAALGIAQIVRRNPQATNFPIQKLTAMMSSTTEAAEVKTMVASALAIRGKLCESFPFLLDQVRQGKQAALSAMEGLDTYNRPAVFRLLEAADAKRANDPAYSKVSLNEYNGILVNTRVLPYALFQRNDASLWAPYTGSFQTDPITCGTRLTTASAPSASWRVFRTNQDIHVTGLPAGHRLQVYDGTGRLLPVRIQQASHETLVSLQTAYTGLCVVVASNANGQMQAKVVR